LQHEKQARVKRTKPDRDNNNNNNNDNDNGKYQVTDEAVMQSYCQSCHPSKGEMGNYLAHANLALRIGELLVLHGALPLTTPVLKQAVSDQEASGKDVSEYASHFWQDLSFAMPWMSDTERKPTNTSVKDSIDAWISSLDHFARRSVESWKQSYNTKSSRIWATTGGYPPDQPEGQLMQYGMGWMAEGKRNPTIVYSSWGVDGMPKRFYLEDVGGEDAEGFIYVRLVQAFFRQAKLRLMLAGHQPQGDSPLPIRIDYDDEMPTSDDPSERFGWVVCCDTSYSGDTQWIHAPIGDAKRENPGRGTGPGFRGDLAVSETLVEMDSEGKIQNVYWHGVLSDGSKYESTPLPLHYRKEEEIRVGNLSHEDWAPSADETPHNTRWWTKAHLRVDDRSMSTLVTTAKGFEVHNAIVRLPN